MWHKQLWKTYSCLVKLNIEKLFKIFKLFILLAGKTKIRNIGKEIDTPNLQMFRSISTAVEP